MGACTGRGPLRDRALSRHGLDGPRPLVHHLHLVPLAVQVQVPVRPGPGAVATSVWDRPLASRWSVGVPGTRASSASTRSPSTAGRPRSGPPRWSTVHRHVVAHPSPPRSPRATSAGTGRSTVPRSTRQPAQPPRSRASVAGSQLTYSSRAAAGLTQQPATTAGSSPPAAGSGWPGPRAAPRHPGLHHPLAGSGPRAPPAGPPPPRRGAPRCPRLYPGGAPVDARGAPRRSTRPGPGPGRPPARAPARGPPAAPPRRDSPGEHVATQLHVSSAHRSGARPRPPGARTRRALAARCQTRGEPAPAASSSSGRPGAYPPSTPASRPRGFARRESAAPARGQSSRHLAPRRPEPVPRPGDGLSGSRHPRSMSTTRSGRSSSRNPARTVTRVATQRERHAVPVPELRGRWRDDRGTATSSPRSGERIGHEPRLRRQLGLVGQVLQGAAAAPVHRTGTALRSGRAPAPGRGADDRVQRDFGLHHLHLHPVARRGPVDEGDPAVFQTADAGASRRDAGDLDDLRPLSHAAAEDSPFGPGTERTNGHSLGRRRTEGRASRAPPPLAMAPSGPSPATPLDLTHHLNGVVVHDDVAQRLPPGSQLGLPERDERGRTGGSRSAAAGPPAAAPRPAGSHLPAPRPPAGAAAGAAAVRGRSPSREAAQRTVSTLRAMWGTLSPVPTRSTS
jgi:hypothetical protein